MKDGPLARIKETTNNKSINPKRRDHGREKETRMKHTAQTDLRLFSGPIELLIDK